MKPKCLYPFANLEFHPKGKVFCCCPPWTKIGPIGNLNKEPLEIIWNGEKIKSLRKKIYQGKYNEVCKTSYCPFIRNPVDWQKLVKTKNKKLKNIVEQIKQKKLHLNTLPLAINIADSSQCNLRCKMCLADKPLQPDKKLSQIIFKKTLPRLLPQLSTIKLSGNGEVFFRKETREFLQQFDPAKHPQIKFEILTNGLLFNKKMWQSIKYNKFAYINVSVDAASKKTYEQIRIGGNWKILQKNLKMLSALRNQGKIKNFFINMTVMRSNCHELEQFAKMGLRLGCDQVLFHKIFGIQNRRENINSFPSSKTTKIIKTALIKPIFNNKKVNIEAIKEYQKDKSSVFQDMLSFLRLSFFVPLRWLAKTIQLRKY